MTRARLSRRQAVTLIGTAAATAALGSSARERQREARGAGRREDALALRAARSRRRRGARVRSPLCHVSASRWCAAAKKTSYSPERKERCGVLTASVARHAVELLNAQAAGKPVLPVLDPKTQECMACHEEKGAVENTRSKMGCNQCHFVLGGKHKDV